MKKTTGISRRFSFLLFASVLSLPAQGAYAVIGGTVFRESGHAFAGALVELQPEKPDKKNKKQSIRTNGRGEFAFRVPAGPMDYSLSVKIESYRPELKRVNIVGDERVDHNFLLDRVTKEK